MTTTQKTFGLMLIVVVAIAIYYLRPILTPFVAGMILAYLGDPLVDRLEARRVNRTVGVLIVFVGFALLLGGAAFIMVPMLVNEVSSLVRDIPLLIAWLQQTASPWLVATFNIDPFDISLESLKARLLENWQQAGGLVGQVVQNVTASGAMLLTTVTSLALTPVVAFYLMRDWDIVVARIREMIPRHLESETVRLTKECDGVLSEFLRGQLLIMFLLGCIYALGLSLIGLDLALLIGMLAGLASIVPYLGFAVGIVAAMFAALFQFQDAIHLVYVLIVFLIGQGLEGMVLTPWLVGDRIGLHPVAVIFAVLAGGQLFGFIGILLALPVAAVAMVFIRHLHINYLRSELYGDSLDVPGADPPQGQGDQQGDSGKAESPGSES
ncbi:MAG: AI-2E family transporter [Proteobacteria bacterium]|nr:AI-2E family transporter [Pseudomonadota bacterium]